MPGSELAVIETATSSLAAVVRSARRIIDAVRNDGRVLAEQRNEFRQRLLAVRDIEKMRNISEVAWAKMQETNRLYELAMTQSNPYGLREALKTADQFARITERMLDDLAQTYRNL